MAGNGSNVLVGWKEIGAYLGCSDRVAKRKARRYGLPVSIDEDGRARALKEDIDTWLRKRVSKGTKTYPKRV